MASYIFEFREGQRFDSGSVEQGFSLGCSLVGLRIRPTRMLAGPLTVLVGSVYQGGLRRTQRWRGQRHGNLSDQDAYCSLFHSGMYVIPQESNAQVNDSQAFTLLSLGYHVVVREMQAVLSGWRRGCME